MDGRQAVKAKASYRELLPEKNYIKNVAAGTISRFGDSVDSIAYPWMTFALTGSAALSATVYGTNLLVSVLMQPFTGALVTGWNKKLTIVLTDAGRGLLVVAAALLYAFGLLAPWMLIAFTVLTSALEAFHNPAALALYPQLVPKEKYTLATSLSGTVQRAAEIAGLAAAGAIIALVGVYGALLVDALTFFASGVILMTLRLPKHVKSAVPSAWKEFTGNTREGFAYVAKNKKILALSLSACALNVVFVPLNALQAAYASDGLRLGAQALSAMGIGTTAGMILGSFVFPKIAARVKRFYIFFASIVISTGAYLGFGFITYLPVDIMKWVGLVTVALFFGFAVSAANACASVSFMENVEEGYLARAGGILSAMCLAAIPVCSYIIAGISSVVPVVTLVIGFGAVALALSALFLLVKPLRDM